MNDFSYTDNENIHIVLLEKKKHWNKLKLRYFRLNRMECLCSVLDFHDLIIIPGAISNKSRPGRVPNHIASQ